MESFLQELLIKNVRQIQKLPIPLGKSERKHLIFTGKNGSGKTSVLNEINALLSKLCQNQFRQLESFKIQIKNLRSNITSTESAIIQSRDQIKSLSNRLDNIKMNRH